MKHLMMVALVAGQLSIAAAPSQAADLNLSDPGSHRQLGAFAGARLRLSLDGHRREPARILLTAAPTVSAIRANGERRTLITGGFELGGRGSQLQLSYEGRPINRLAGDPQRNISTLGWVAIGVGATVVLGYLALGVCYETGGCFEGE